MIIDCLRCAGSGRLEVYDRGVSVSVMICPDCGGCKVVEVPDDLPTVPALDCAAETMPEILVGRRA